MNKYTSFDVKTAKSQFSSTEKPAKLAKAAKVQQNQELANAKVLLNPAKVLLKHRHGQNFSNGPLLCLGVSCQHVSYHRPGGIKYLWCGHQNKPVIDMQQCPHGAWAKDSKGFPIPDTHKGPGHNEIGEAKPEVNLNDEAKHAATTDKTDKSFTADNPADYPTICGTCEHAVFRDTPDRFCLFCQREQQPVVEMRTCPLDAWRKNKEGYQI